MFTHLTMEDMAQIARIYKDAPRYRANAHHGWSVLGRVAREMRLLLETNGLNVVEVAEAEPYRGHEDMFAAIKAGTLHVSTLHCDHPVWDPETNIAFRVWHDMCHYQTQGDFKLQGELAACSKQMDELYERVSCAAAGLALYTECIGQLAFNLTYGYFGIQKVAYLGSLPSH